MYLLGGSRIEVSLVPSEMQAFLGSQGSNGELYLLPALQLSSSILTISTDYLSRHLVSAYSVPITSWPPR